jgi:hypothetical protein
VGYASVQIDEHRENYSINSKAFKSWLRTKYGNTYQIKIGEEWHPQVVGDGPLKDAVSTLEGYANLKPDTEIKPAVRVGKCNGEIWIDFGGPDWSSVRVTAKGWNVVEWPEKPKVAFVRSQKMLPLPRPVRGGNIWRLAEVLNVREEQFVLAVGWLLQALNPDGPYPLIYPSGPSGLGKSTTTRLLCRTVDPNSVQIRKMNRVEDLLIAAKNNWVVAFDNCSSISRDLSDTLSMLATGIGVGKRANYTDDEEHSFVVERPVAFNGIPGDLTWAADLASRTIKLDVPALETRRTDTELEKTFAEIWPGVFGALLEGLVGALAGAGAINVADIELRAARLMDFEQWAEAGCRAMGFGRWEFVRAYGANRTGSMVAVAEASPVARAVVEFIGQRQGSYGYKMDELLQRLNRYRGDTKHWPVDATRLSGALRRLIEPLAAQGIEVELDQDLRPHGIETQNGVLLRRMEETCV